MLAGMTVCTTIFKLADVKDTLTIHSAIKNSAADSGAVAASMIAACCMILGEEVADAHPPLPFLEGVIALISKFASASVEVAKEAEEDNDE